jgi:GTP-binding protein HflX
VGVTTKGGRPSAAGGRAAAARAMALATAAGADRAAAAAAGPPALELSPEESLDELEALAATAGLEVIGRLTQAVEGGPNPRTYLNTGKLEELGAALEAAGADTAIFDDELSPGQARTLERALGSKVRLCDRTALILDIFAQRAASAEGQLQVALAAAEYQLPRLTRLWTHLERQSGGRTKGMGEKQLEVDKRLLRARMSGLKSDLEDVRRQRAGRAARRAAAGLPTVALVGYTSAGKSSLLNALTGAGVLADDRLFATLDPATRRMTLPAGKEVLVCDTVGFIQKLPTSLVAAFRATLEAAVDADLLLHVVDVSHPAAAAQSAAVAAVLAEVGALGSGGGDGEEGGGGDEGAPPTTTTTTTTTTPLLLTVWNKVDAAPDPGAVRAVAAARRDTFPVSALTGEGLDALVAALECAVGAALLPVAARLPFSAGDLAAEARRSGVVAGEGFTPDGILLLARVPPSLAARLAPHAMPVPAAVAALAEAGVEVGSSGEEAWWVEN